MSSSSKKYGTFDESCLQISLDCDACSIKFSGVNNHYINEIRSQGKSEQRPALINLGFAGSLRRPLVRANSETDFQALLDTRKGRELTKQFIKKYAPQSQIPISSIRKFNATQWIILVCLALVNFTSFCTMSIMAPFFPKEAASKGVPFSVSGFVFSIYAMVVFLASPLMGIVVNQVGSKVLLILGVFLCGSCNILFGVLDKVSSTLPFIVLCFLVRAFEAVGTALFNTACYTYVAHQFDDKMGVVLGLLETFVGLGLCVGPALGGLLYDYGGYGLPFYSLGGFMLLTIPFHMQFLPSTDPVENTCEPKGSIWKILKMPSVLVVCLVVTVSSNAWGFIDPSLEPHLRDFDLSAKQLGLLFLLSAAFYTLSSPIWGWIADRMERTWILMSLGLWLSAIGLVLMGPAPFFHLPKSIWLNVVGLMILGTASAMSLLPTFEAMLDYALEGGCSDDIGTYGLISGIWSSAYSLGEVIGPSFGGVLLESSGFEIAATVMGLLSFCLGCVVFMYFAPRHKSIGIDDSVIISKSTKVETDSGISDSDVLSSNGCDSCTGQDILIEVDEKTPLIIKRVLENSKGGHDLKFTISNQNENSLQSDLYIPAASAVPEVLKTIGFTTSGALEI